MNEQSKTKNTLPQNTSPSDTSSNTLEQKNKELQEEPSEELRKAVGSVTYGQIDRDILEKAEAEVPEEWKKGDVILGLYEVTDILGAGGFGVVHKVHHRGWNMELAVKSLLKEYLKEKKKREAFIRECEGWINLGFHPNIVSCYYVRDLGGHPRIFTEFMEGRTLEDWIDNEKIKGWEQITDLAIQCLDGMGYAHRKGLVHRDIKPANCLMTSEGALKITDFGIASGLATLGMDITEGKEFNVTGTMILQEGGIGTPAYMPPEQWDKKYGETGPWSDIYAFGVMLFEMCCGERPFDEGGEDISVLKIRHTSVVSPNPKEINEDIPEALSQFILSCLKKSPEQRYQNCYIPRDNLVRIYEEITGKFYLRELTEEVELQADGLNNRAVSMIDLGKKDEAEEIFNEALRIEPSHPEATYNQGLVLWRSARITDDGLIRKLEAIKSGEGKDRVVCYLSGLVHIERGDGEKAEKELKKSFELSKTGEEQSDEIKNSLIKAKEGKNKWGRCLKIFQGHTDSVNSVCISENKTFAISGGDDRTLFIWDINSGKCIKKLEGHTDCIFSVDISRDGKLAISGSFDKTLRVWDLNSGKCCKTLKNYFGPVFSVIFSPDDKFILSGNLNNISLWDLAKENITKTFGSENWLLRSLKSLSSLFSGELFRSVSSVCISPDGKLALTGSRDGTLRLWDLKSGKCFITFEGHIECISSVCISPDSKLALSGSYDDTLRLWDLGSGKCLRTFKGHSERVSSVCISPDNRLVLSGSYDRTLRLWNIENGQCLRTFEGHSDWINSAVISSDGKSALSGSKDKTLRLWDLNRGEGSSFFIVKPRSIDEEKKNKIKFKKLLRRAEELLEADSAIEAIKKVEEAQRLPGYKRAQAVLDLRWKIGRQGNKYSLRDVWSVRSLEGHSDSVYSVCISPDGKFALSGSRDKTLRLWDLGSGKCLRVFEGHKGPVYSVCISPDGRFGLSGSWDGNICLWDLKTGKNSGVIGRHFGTVTSVSIFSDGVTVISGGEDKTLLEWKLKKPYLRKFTGHNDVVTSVCISPDGKFALSASQDRTLRLWDIEWDLERSQCVKTFTGHTDLVRSVCISSDGKSALSGSFDKTLRLWDLDSGECTGIFTGHQGMVFCGAIFPYAEHDGKFGLSGSEDKTLRLWNLENGECLKVIEGSTGTVLSLCISAGGRFALSGNDDNIIRLWEFDWKYKFRKTSNIDYESENEWEISKKFNIFNKKQ